MKSSQSGTLFYAFWKECTVHIWLLVHSWVPGFWNITTKVRWKITHAFISRTQCANQYMCFFNYRRLNNGFSSILKGQPKLYLPSVQTSAHVHGTCRTSSSITGMLLAYYYNASARNGSYKLHNQIGKSQPKKNKVMTTTKFCMFPW